MIDLQIYVYLLIFIVLLLVYIGYTISMYNTDRYTKLILLWTICLFEFNFINMIVTLRNYIHNSNRVGPQGPQGIRGPRGLKGSDAMCNQCHSGPLPTKFGGDIDDSGKKDTNDKCVIGDCIFPFVHNNEFKYDCTTEQIDPKLPNNANINGWCATSLNSDMTYKTYGYCNKSDENKLNESFNQTREQQKQNYEKNNYGLTDIKLISGRLSNIICPKGYIKIDKDMNSNNNGNFVYLCKKIGLNDTGINDITIKKGKIPCKQGYRQIEGNINDERFGESTDKDALNLCVKETQSNFINDINIEENSNCSTNYSVVGSNLNIGGDPRYLCVSKLKSDPFIINTAFVWNDDLYFFKDNNYWKYIDPSRNTSETKKDYPKQLNQFWGKLNSPIDAVLVDDKTYFFKGNEVYLYDDNNEAIAPGYPKFIKDEWSGVPNNLDAIYVSKDKDIYFIRGRFYYPWNKTAKKTDPAKTVVDTWAGAPDIINAMFDYNNKTYIIETNMVYELDNDGNVPNGPKIIDTVFKV